MSEISFLTFGESAPQVGGSWGAHEMLSYLGNIHVEEQTWEWLAPIPPCSAQRTLEVKILPLEKPENHLNAPRRMKVCKTIRFIHLLSKYSLSAFYVPAIISG